MITWKNLTRNGKILFGTIVFLIATLYFIIPAGRLLWFLATNDIAVEKPHQFTPCDYTTPSITWSNTGVMTVNKTLHFCGSHENAIPAKTQIAFENGSQPISSIYEDALVAKFAKPVHNLPINEWHVVAK
ncbi:MAG: hypothetical protein U9Q12_03375 [Patescibacteria group bacterium]|nr:hypothetical protein [Patescibacteria group bacterium]